MTEKLFNHVTASLSDLDMEMVKAVPPGGNWKDINEETFEKSKRLQNIRESGGRTTYYGRLKKDEPSYTINTYFNRPGNGTFIHPEEDRLISIREAARLQSFQDSYRFFGSLSSQRNQVGNAVPPLLGRAIGKKLPGEKVLDLFCGAGGLSKGLSMAGFKEFIGVEKVNQMVQTIERNHKDIDTICGDLTDPTTQRKVLKTVEEKFSEGVDVIVGGPPCQGFSTAGDWRNDDPRDNLFKPMLKIVEELNPKSVLIENVRGIKWKNDGKAFESIKGWIKELGYNLNVKVLKAEEYGVPQKRRRVFFLGMKKKTPKLPEPIFSGEDRNSKLTSFEENSKPTSPPITVWETISDLPSLGPGEGEEIMPYNDSWTETDYQLFLRSKISFEEFMNKKT